MSWPISFRLSKADWAFAVCLCLFAGGIAWSWHMPTFGELQSLSNQVTDGQGRELELLEVDETLDRFETDTAELELRLAHFEDRLFTAEEEEKYLDAVSRFQEQCDVSLQELSPGSVRGEGHYETQSIEIVTVSAFSNLMCFLYQLDGSLTSAQMVGLRIHAEPDQSECSMSVHVDIYRDTTRNGNDDDAGEEPEV